MATFDPDSICPGAPTIQTPAGPKPVGLADADAYTVKVIRSADAATDALGPAHGRNRYPAELASLSFPADGGGGVLTLAPRDAAMIAVYRLLDGLIWQSFDLQALLDDGNDRIAITRHMFKRTTTDGRDLPTIYFDWPEWANEDMPEQTALITSDEEEWTHDAAGLNPRLLDETLGRFGEGTVLRYLGEMAGPLTVICLCAHKDQRRGLEARLAQLFAAERWDDRFGRRVIVPEYFSREVRLELTGITRTGGPPEAIGNRWGLSLSIQAEIEHVELVRAPGFMSAFFDVRTA